MFEKLQEFEFDPNVGLVVSSVSADVSNANPYCVHLQSSGDFHPVLVHSLVDFLGENKHASTVTLSERTIEDTTLARSLGCFGLGPHIIPDLKGMDTAELVAFSRYLYKLGYVWWAAQVFFQIPQSNRMTYAREHRVLENAVEGLKQYWKVKAQELHADSYVDGNLSKIFLSAVQLNRLDIAQSAAEGMINHREEYSCLVNFWNTVKEKKTPIDLDCIASLLKSDNFYLRYYRQAVFLILYNNRCFEYCRNLMDAWEEQDIMNMPYINQASGDICMSERFVAKL